MHVRLTLRRCCEDGFTEGLGLERHKTTAKIEAEHQDHSRRPRRKAKKRDSSHTPEASPRKKAQKPTLGKTKLKRTHTQHRKTSIVPHPRPVPSSSDLSVPPWTKKTPLQSRSPPRAFKTLSTTVPNMAPRVSTPASLFQVLSPATAKPKNLLCFSQRRFFNKTESFCGF